MLLLFSAFSNAEATPEKIIAITIHKGMSVLQVYNHNKNYLTKYTPQSFTEKVCVNNPQQFKDCTETEFRHIRAESILSFPALPEARGDKTVQQVYKQNEVYRTLFSNFTKFKNEICKNNPSIKPCTTRVVKNITADGLKITDRPLTYIIIGEKPASVVINGKTFKKSEKGEYYSPVKQELETTKSPATTKTGEVDRIKTTLLLGVKKTTPTHETVTHSPHKRKRE